MKYGRVLWKPFECDYQCKEGFNLSPQAKRIIQYVDFFEQPTYCSNDSELSSFLIKMSKLCCLMTASVCTLCRSQSSEAESCKRLSSKNGNWIDVVCCHEHLNE